jgi:hypothetical protein
MNPPKCAVRLYAPVTLLSILFAGLKRFSEPDIAFSGSTDIVIGAAAIGQGVEFPRTTFEAVPWR